jgi:2-polyprenyl-6-hydroxyphenyl methylase/3-demethylubiquinone-9 3-methyltransferase
MEMLEHVPDPNAVVQACAKLARPGGTLVFSTINRNPKSWLFAIVGAEYVLRWVPAGTHDWRKFLTPQELRGFLEGHPFDIDGPFGVTYNPLTGKWGPSSDADVNYMMTVTRAAK